MVPEKRDIPEDLMGGKSGTCITPYRDSAFRLSSGYAEVLSVQVVHKEGKHWSSSLPDSHCKCRLKKWVFRNKLSCI